MAIWTGLDVFAPARAMLAALRQKQVWSLELTGLHLARIAHNNRGTQRNRGAGTRPACSGGRG